MIWVGQEIETKCHKDINWKVSQGIKARKKSLVNMHAFYRGRNESQELRYESLLGEDISDMTEQALDNH